MSTFTLTEEERERICQCGLFASFKVGLRADESVEPHCDQLEDTVKAIIAARVAEQREQIAQEIEAHPIGEGPAFHDASQMRDHAARIARGQS